MKWNLRMGYMLLSLAFVGLTACGGNDETTVDQPEITEKEEKDGTDIQPDGNGAGKKMPGTSHEEITAPTFRIKIDLSDKALAKLQGTKETIMIDVAFSAELKPNSKLEKSDDGQFYLANASREIKPGQTATFSGIMIPKEIMGQLKDDNYEVSVNVFTNRRVFPNNVISTLGAFGKISEFKGKLITIDAKLIEE